MCSSLQGNKIDVRNFDKDFTRERPVLTPPADKRAIEQINQHEFRDFDFVNETFLRWFNCNVPVKLYFNKL